MGQRPYPTDTNLLRTAGRSTFSLSHSPLLTLRSSQSFLSRVSLSPLRSFLAVGLLKAKSETWVGYRAACQSNAKSPRPFSLILLDIPPLLLKSLFSFPRSSSTFRFYRIYPLKCPDSARTFDLVLIVSFQRTLPQRRFKLETPLSLQLTSAPTSLSRTTSRYSHYPRPRAHQNPSRRIPLHLPTNAVSLSYHQQPRTLTLNVHQPVRRHLCRRKSSTPAPSVCRNSSQTLLISTLTLSPLVRAPFLISVPTFPTRIRPLPLLYK